MEPTNQLPVQKPPTLTTATTGKLHAFFALLKRKPLYGIAFVLMSVLFVLFAVVLLLPLRRAYPTLTQPTPTPFTQATPTPLPRQTSQTAKTEEFIRMEEQLKQTTAEINNLDLLESRLTFPVLDVSISFTN